MPPRPLLFAPLAQRHLHDLHGWIAAEGGRARADAYVASLVRYCASLAEFPLRGAARDDLLPGLRLVGWRRRATIGLAIEGGTVVIHGVFHGGAEVRLPQDR